MGIVVRLLSTLKSGKKGTTKSYLRHFDPYLRLKRDEQKDFWKEIRQFLCATFRGEVMRQFGLWARLCVRRQRNISSHYAQFTGELMRQQRRIYGISNTGGRKRSFSAATLYSTERKKKTLACWKEVRYTQAGYIRSVPLLEE